MTGGNVSREDLPLLRALATAARLDKLRRSGRISEVDLGQLQAAEDQLAVQSGRKVLEIYLEWRSAGYPGAGAFS